MRICAVAEITAPPDAVWEVVSDQARLQRFMAGLTRWEVVGGTGPGLGTRIRMLMRVGSAEVGGLIEIVEWELAREIAWTSVTGVDQRGRWRLRERSDGGQPRTHVELRLSYGIAGSGLWGWVAEQVAAPTVRGNLRRSLQQLKRQVEAEQLRRRAARRRRASTAAG
jgi:uncharacterized membrane protein